MFISAGLCLGQGVPWFWVQHITIYFNWQQPLSPYLLGHEGKRNERQRPGGKENRVRECKEQFLWPCGLELLCSCSRWYRQTIINSRGFCDDSPRVKRPIETTAQCVYFSASRFGVITHPSQHVPASLTTSNSNTHTKKCRCLWNFIQWFISSSRNIYTLLPLDKTNLASCIKDILVCLCRYGWCKQQLSI